jgi:hypothetical protein
MEKYAAFATVAELKAYYRKSPTLLPQYKLMVNEGYSFILLAQPSSILLFYLIMRNKNAYIQQKVYILLFLQYNMEHSTILILMVDRKVITFIFLILYI